MSTNDTTGATWVIPELSGHVTMERLPGVGYDAAIRQTDIASAEFAGKKRKTWRERLTSEMNAVAPWSRLQALIEPD